MSKALATILAAIWGLLIAGLASAQQSQLQISPVTDAMLANPDPQDWLMWRRTLDSWGYSPLSQIDTSNVQQLRMMWSRGLEPGLQEGTPLVHDGVMFFPNPRDVIQAFDAVTGDLLWEHRRAQPEDIEKFINAPFINRNLAIHGNLIIDTSADGYIYALDARNGKEVWATQVRDYKTGIHHTSGPIIADGKVFSGRGCEPLPDANPDTCVIVAHDAQTGRELWRTRTIPGPGEPGNETWGDVPFGERKHVGAWMPPSYDPELKRLYIGTSVTSPAPKFLLGGNDRKHLYHNCTLALDAQTGKIIWYYQHVVDHWDLDHTFERLLLDTEVAPSKDAVPWISPDIKAGQKYAVLTGIPGKTGIVYTLDRRSGKFLWARPTVFQNVVSTIDGRTGAVTVNPKALFAKRGDEADTCPGTHGGKIWTAGAYSPLTGAMYFPLQNTCTRLTATIADRSEHSTYGIRMSLQPAPGGQNVGTVQAISVRTGVTEWKYEQRAGTLSLLTTGGGLLFGGDAAGRFRAFDQRTGQILWEINLGSPVTGYPITYAVRGKQYIAASVGQAVTTGALQLLTPDVRASSNNVMFIFALPDNLQPTPVTRTTPAPAAASVSAQDVTAALASQCRRGTPPTRIAAGPNTVEGTFTVAQSEAGRKAYTAQQCATCHGDNMRGAAGGPALVDSAFQQAWSGRPLGDLFDCVKGTMPPGRASTLGDGDYMDIIAAILQANGVTLAGDVTHLPSDPVLLNRIAFPGAP